jgi:serine/threonine-protein kinase
MDLVGKQFGQYEITALIGAGGMGEVYRARDTRLTREVAIKVLPPELARDEEFVQRFMREANTAASLDHPNIINIYNVDAQDGMYYIVMRLAQGETLRDVLRRGRLAPRRLLAIMGQLADALGYAHQKGIIHRDIKPANIMVGENDRVTLMDFGIAKALSGLRITRTGTAIGTPEYMSPEQFKGEDVGPRTDIYALGIVLYELLTGTVPFKGETSHVVSHKHVYDPPPPPRQHDPQIPPAVEAVVLRCLEKQPVARYQTAGEMFAALRVAVESAITGPRPQVQATGGPLKLVLSTGQEYPVGPGVVSIGRGSGNTIVINNTQVSRQHAEIRSETGGGSVLIDFDSTNGTFVDGQRLSPRVPNRLHVGQQVHFGKQISARVAHGAVAPGAAPSAAPQPLTPFETTASNDVLSPYSASDDLPVPDPAPPPPPEPRPAEPSAPQKKYNPFWPPLDTLDSARKAGREGAWACLLIVIVNVAMVVLDILYSDVLVDTVIFAVFGIAIYKMSRVGAVLALLLYVVERVYMLSEWGVSPNFLSLILLLMFIHGVRGTFAYHKLDT